MLGLELLTWLAAGLAVGGAYGLWAGTHHAPWGMPLLAGVFGALGLGWLIHVLGPTDVAAVSYRPLMLVAAVVGAVACVVTYHLYRQSATPRTR